MSRLAVALFTSLALGCGLAHAESDGNTYKCPGNTYFNNLSAAEAASKGCVILSGPPPASNWTFIGLASETCSYYWDKSTLFTRGIYRKAWFMQTCRDSTELVGQPIGASNRSETFLMYFKCDEPTAATVQLAFYSDENGKGKPGAAYSYRVEQLQFTESAPNTYGALWLSMACAGTKKTQP